MSILDVNAKDLKNGDVILFGSSPKTVTKISFEGEKVKIFFSKEYYKCTTTEQFKVRRPTFNQIIDFRQS